MGAGDVACARALAQEPSGETHEYRGWERGRRGRGTRQIDHAPFFPRSQPAPPPSLLTPPHPPPTTDNWSEKSLRRKTTGTGRMRYMKDLPRRATNGFREGSEAAKAAAPTA